MPERRDEYWAGQRYGKGKPLCPFCGSPHIQRVYRSDEDSPWMCGGCEKVFPFASYGGNLHDPKKRFGAAPQRLSVEAREFAFGKQYIQRERRNKVIAQKKKEEELSKFLKSMNLKPNKKSEAGSDRKGSKKKKFNNPLIRLSNLLSNLMRKERD